jgi:hypothetical protein
MLDFEPSATPRSSRARSRCRPAFAQGPASWSETPERRAQSAAGSPDAMTREMIKWLHPPSQLMKHVKLRRAVPRHIPRPDAVASFSSWCVPAPARPEAGS